MKWASHFSNHQAKRILHRLRMGIHKVLRGKLVGVIERLEIAAIQSRKEVVGRGRRGPRSREVYST